MIDTILPESLEAAKDAAFMWIRQHMEDDVRVKSMTDDELGEIVFAACLAALNAWPGAYETPRAYNMMLGDHFDSLIIPLRQEPRT